MNIGAIGGVTGSAHAAAIAIAQAIKASGAIIKVEPRNFMKIIGRMDTPLIIMAETKFITKTYKYLTSYRGLTFFTQSKIPLQLPSNSELILAKKIWIPG